MRPCTCWCGGRLRVGRRHMCGGCGRAAAGCARGPLAGMRAPRVQAVARHRAGHSAEEAAPKRREMAGARRCPQGCRASCIRQGSWLAPGAQHRPAVPSSIEAGCGLWGLLHRSLGCAPSAGGQRDLCQDRSLRAGARAAGRRRRGQAAGESCEDSLPWCSCWSLHARRRAYEAHGDPSRLHARQGHDLLTNVSILSPNETELERLTGGAGSGPAFRRSSCEA